MLTTIPLGIIDSAGGRTYATWSPVNKASSIILPAGYGNLKFQTISPAQAGGTCISTIGMSTGKWYWEITVNAISSTSAVMCGIADSYKTTNALNTIGVYANSIGYRPNTGSYTFCFFKNGIRQGANGTCPNDILTNDVLSFALDMGSRTFTFYINGVQAGLTQTLPGLPAGGTTYYAVCGSDGVANNGGTANFGQNAWSTNLTVTSTRNALFAAGYNRGIYN